MVLPQGTHWFLASGPGGRVVLRGLGTGQAPIGMWQAGQGTGRAATGAAQVVLGQQSHAQLLHLYQQQALLQQQQQQQQQAWLLSGGIQQQQQVMLPLNQRVGSGWVVFRMQLAAQRLLGLGKYPPSFASACQLTSSSRAGTSVSVSAPPDTLHGFSRLTRTPQCTRRARAHAGTGKRLGGKAGRGTTKRAPHHRAAADWAFAAAAGSPTLDGDINEWQKL